MSVDPFVHLKAGSQGINPYSYIFNNPLAGTDPTGYEPGDRGAALGLSINVAMGWFTEEEARIVEQGEAANPFSSGVFQGSTDLGLTAKTLLVTGSIVAAAEYGSRIAAKRASKSTGKNRGNKTSDKNGSNSSVKSDGNNTDIGSQDKKADLIVSRDGAVVHNSTEKVNNSLKQAGFKGEITSNDSKTEFGTKYIDRDKNMLIRVMDGGPKHEPRVVTSRIENPHQNVNPVTGANFGNVKGPEQKARSHIYIEGKTNVERPKNVTAKDTVRIVIDNDNS